MNVYLALISIATCLSGMRVLGSTGVWTLGDWLINYSGGFVRRGLPGFLALHMQQAFHVRSAVVVIGILILLYLFLFLCIRTLAANIHWDFWMVAVFVSPVTVASAFVSTSGYHKEVLFIAAFAGLLVRLLYLHQQQLQPSWKESAWITVVGVIGVLSHEMFAIYFPYVLTALYVARPDMRRLLRISVVPILGIALAAGAVVTHPGTPALARTVCASLGTDKAVCKGSIEYLGRTRADAHADVVESVDEYHYLAFLPTLTLLGLIPMLAGFWSLRRVGVSRGVWTALIVGTALSIMFSALLFVYGADWGRWIEIHLMSLFLLLLFCRALYDRGYSPQNPLPRGRGLMIGQAALLIVYATCWSLPGTTNIPKGGYVSMASRISERALSKGR